MYEIRILPTGSQRKLVLCDAEGNMLPGQVRSQLDCDVGSSDKFTVTFNMSLLAFNDQDIAQPAKVVG